MSSSESLEDFRILYYTQIDEHGKWARMNDHDIPVTQIPHGILDSLEARFPGSKFAFIIWEHNQDDYRDFDLLTESNDPRYVKGYPQRNEDMQPMKVVAFMSS